MKRGDYTVKETRPAWMALWIFSQQRVGQSLSIEKVMLIAVQ
jgi:hypothetical protein